MENHPIDGLMNTAMNSIKEMVDVNTIIGDPIETTNNVVIIPVSKVNFGFAAGGSEFNGKSLKTENDKEHMPFGGGAGAGVSINPIAFIVVQSTGVKLLPVNHSSNIDKLLDLVPDLIDKVNTMLEKKLNQIDQNEEKIKNEIQHKSNSTKQNDAKNYTVEYDETDM